MGLLSKIFKGIKKIVKKIGRGIKKVAKKIGGAFGKLGILGHIGLMFLMPYAGALWSKLGTWATTLAQGTSIAGKAFGHIMRGIYHAGKAVGTVYKGITEAVSGSLKWIGNKVGAVFGKEMAFGEPWKGLSNWADGVKEWGAEGWTGTIGAKPSSFVNIGGKRTHFSDLSEELQEIYKSPEVNMTEDLFKQTAEFQAAYPDSKAVTAKVEDTTVDASADTTVDASAAATEEAADRTFKDKTKDYWDEYWGKTKEEFSPAGMAEKTGSVITGFGKDVSKNAASRLVFGKPEPANFGGTVSFDGYFGDTPTITDPFDLDQYKVKGYNYGSPMLEQSYEQVMQSGDAFWEWYNEQKSTLAGQPNQPSIVESMIKGG